MLYSSSQVGMDTGLYFTLVFFAFSAISTSIFNIFTLVYICDICDIFAYITNLVYILQILYIISLFIKSYFFNYVLDTYLYSTVCCTVGTDFYKYFTWYCYPHSLRDFVMLPITVTTIEQIRTNTPISVCWVAGQKKKLWRSWHRIRGVAIVVQSWMYFIHQPMIGQSCLMPRQSPSMPW